MDAPVVMVGANQAWNLVHFRGALIRALVRQGWRVVAVAPPDDVWPGRLIAMGCDFVPVAIDAAGMRPWRDALLLWRLWRLMRRHRPAAWLSWTIKPNLYGALAARAAGVAAMPNVSGLGTAFLHGGGLNALVGWLYAMAFRACPTVFFQNADDRAVFVARGLVRSGQARLLPGSGIDLDHFAPAPRPAAAGCHFLMIARVLADKGVREFVAAARAVRAQCPQARFTLMGAVGVPNRSAIARAEVDGWVAEGVIDWRSPVDDVRPAIAGADWIVLPSYREGLSRVLVEAAAMARPVIATDVPGCRDCVAAGETGLLVPPRDAPALARAMAQAVALDAQGWARMAAAGRALAERRYGIDRIIALYGRALAGATNIHSGDSVEKVDLVSGDA